jgi:hypothetical protein
VERWTIGFIDFRNRSKVWKVRRELIADAAHMYARATPGVIPWTPITINSGTAARRSGLQCALRAHTGSLDIKGGDIFRGFNPLIVSESELELHAALPESQGQAARVG